MPKRITRVEARVLRRRAYYLGKVRDSGSSDMARLGAAVDYVRALLSDADPHIRQRVGEHVMGVLLSTAATLEPEMRGAAR